MIVSSGLFSLTLHIQHSLREGFAGACAHMKTNKKNDPQAHNVIIGQQFPCAAAVRLTVNRRDFLNRTDTRPLLDTVFKQPCSCGMLVD